MGISGFGQTTTEGKPNSAFLTAGGNTYSLIPGQSAAGTPIDVNGNGYLRLTDNTNNQTGYVYNETRFPSNDGIHVEFEYFTYGGQSDRNADGITLFLFDADVPTFSIGAFGGSLGYAQKHDPDINPPVLNLPGVSGGFLGVGIDEYGNFANPIEGRQGGVINADGGSNGRHHSSITLRGDGNGAALTPDNYEYIIHQRTDNPVNGNFQIEGGVDGRLMIPQPSTAFPGYRKVIVDIVPDDPGNISYFTVTVDVIHGNQTDRVINQQYTPSSGIPSHLKYGFASSTGSYTNYHEIRSIDIVVPAGVIKAPVAVADAANTVRGLAKTINIISNDYDPNGNATLDLSTVDINPNIVGRQTVFTVVGEGVYSVDDEGNLTFTPTSTFVGPTTPIKYTIYDNGEDLHGAVVTIATISNEAEVTFTVTPNDPPIAGDDSYTVAEGGTKTVATPGVMDNDSDPEGATITATVVTGPAHGTLTLNPDGSFTYVHDGSETLSDSYTYRISDGAFDSNTATVTIIVTPVDDAPIALNDAYTVVEGATRIVGAAVGVLSNDSDPEGAALTASLVTGPVHGTITFNSDGSFTYIHNGGEAPTDSFTYKVTAGSLSSNATVTITITPVNDPPVAVADAYTVAEGATLTISALNGVLKNDSDPENDPLRAILVGGPTNGTLTLNTDGSFTYVHNGSETTSDNFTYKVNDGTVDGNTVTVNITVSPVNDPPVAQPDAYTVAEGGTLTVPTVSGVLNNDSDAENALLTAILVTNPSHGTLSLNPNGSFTYVHNGTENFTDSYTYKANDGTSTSNTATVSITITPVNDPPIATGDTYTVDEGGTLRVASPGVLSNDTDAEGNPIRAILVSGPTNGTLTFNSNGSFTYIHNGSKTTTDTYTYKVNDGIVDGNTVTVTINMTDFLPLIADIVKSGVKNTTLTFNALDFTSKFVDTDPLVKIRIVTLPVNGILKLNGVNIVPNQEIPATALNDITFTPDLGFIGGPLDFQWNGSDGTHYAAVPKDIKITIAGTSAPSNTAPLAVSDSYSINKGGTLSIATPGVLSNDSDADGNSITAIKVLNPTNGTVTLNANGSFTYIHNDGSSTSDSFTYKVNDGISDGNTVTVSIVITAVRTQPLVANVAKVGTGFTPITFTRDDFAAKFTSPNGASLTKIRVTSLPPLGVLKLNGVQVIAGQEIPAATISTLTYEPPVNWNGTTSFPWNGSDGNSYAINDASVELIVLLSGDPSAKIGLAKNLESVKSGLNGTYDVSFLFTVKNYGLNKLEAISLKDNLLTAFPNTDVKVKSLTASGSLNVNTGYNGNSDTELVLTSSTLNAGEEATVSLSLNIRLLSSGGLFQNSAIGSGISSINGVRVTDVSTNGLRPDPLLNNDVTASSATPIQLDTNPAYVPAGFSPNGDGMNDKFVLQNTQGKQVSLEVYNRWGNRVYKSANYQNEWDGSVTEGLFIGRDIPDGTYYYIVVIDRKERYTGFITVNR